MRLVDRFAFFAALMLTVQPACVSSQKIEYLTPDEALTLEHQTRYQRLRRIVDTYNIFPSPQFFDYLIPSDKMPADFRHDTPVLRIVFPEKTFFDTGSAEILPSAFPIITAMAKMLDGDVPDVNVFVAGHTDSRGGEDYNHNLSIARAKAVTAALIAARNQAYPIWSIGFGKSLPIYPNTTDGNMAYNRRVEFLLGARPEAVSYWLQQQFDIVCQTTNATEKLRCLLDLTKVHHVYEAEEEGRRQAISLTKASNTNIQPNEKIRKVDATPRRLTIRLNEQRLHVSSIEH